MSRSTRPHKSRLSPRSYHETALPARVTPEDDQRSPAKSCSLFEGVTTHDSRRHQCGKPGRDPGRITTWLAGHRRRSQPPVASRNLPTSFITRRGARTYGKLVSKSGKHVFFASCSRGVCAPAHVAREIYLGKSCALSRDPGTRRCKDEVVPPNRLARDVWV